MHSPSLYPAGRGLRVDLGSDAHSLRALVVEDTAKKLVRNKVLRAYSVGIAEPVITRDPTGRAPGGIVTGGVLAEVSLVDRPANKNCQLVLAKAAGHDVPWTYGDLDGLLAKAQARPDALGADGNPDDGNPDEDPTDNLPDDDPDGDGEDNSTDADLAKSTYDGARTAWQAREPGLLGAPTSGTEFLAKRALWQRWYEHGEAEGLDGTPDGRARWLAKREFDTGVGGGVDRDTIPTGDFGDPGDRKYPIVTPGDVSDAAGLVGHATDPDSVRDRIIAIAHRKGPSFVAELPDTWTGKNITLTSPDAQGLVPYNLAGQGTHAGKAAKACRKCGTQHHADSKLRRCENCGKKLPRAVDTVDKGGRRMLPVDVAPAGEHREPDGSAVEALEDDAGWREPGEPPETPDQIPASVDGGVPYTVKRMHDAVCAAYDWDTVTDAYPSLKSVADALVPAWFGDRVVTATAKGDWVGAFTTATLAADAEVIVKRQIDPAVLADAHGEVHKAFTDMYPTVAVHPIDVTPGRFHRPYLSTGHAPLSAGAGAAAPTVPPSSRVIHPDDFTRPLITSGHEAGSPGDGGDNLDTGGSLASGAARVYSRNAGRAAVRSAMQAMHDHISGTFPDLCPMATSKAAVPPGMAADARPVPVVAPVMGRAPGETVRKGRKTRKDKAATLNPDAITKAVADAVRQASTDMTSHYQQQITALQAEIDNLGAQPDPNQAPMRGVLGKQAPAPAVTEPAPVGLIETAKAAAAADLIERVAFLGKFLNHPNPAQREGAEAELRKLLTS
jgi:hypothetical protein